MTHLTDLATISEPCMETTNEYVLHGSREIFYVTEVASGEFMVSTLKNGKFESWSEATMSMGEVIQQAAHKRCDYLVSKIENDLAPKKSRSPLNPFVAVVVGCLLTASFAIAKPAPSPQELNLTPPGKVAVAFKPKVFHQISFLPEEVPVFNTLASVACQLNSHQAPKADIRKQMRSELAKAFPGYSRTELTERAAELTANTAGCRVYRNYEFRSYIHNEK